MPYHLRLKMGSAGSKTGASLQKFHLPTIIISIIHELWNY